MTQEFLDIARQVLDRQLVDSNNVPCGKVDDVEIEGRAGGELKIRALLVGNGAASDRLPELFKAISGALFGRRIVRVPWSEVSVTLRASRTAAGSRETMLPPALKIW